MNPETQTKIAAWRARIESLKTEAAYLKKEIEIRVEHLALTDFSMKRGNGPFPWVLELAAMQTYLTDIPAMEAVLQGYIETREKELTNEHE